MISYDVFVAAFLAKVQEYDFADILDTDLRESIVDGYLKAAMSKFQKVSKVSFTQNDNAFIREYDVELKDSDDLDEIASIVSEGMVVQWLKPYLYNQELLQQQLNTKDFTTYSPAELLMRIGNAHSAAARDFRNQMYDYSFFNNDLSGLHL